MIRSKHVSFLDISDMNLIARRCASFSIGVAVHHHIHVRFDEIFNFEMEEEMHCLHIVNIR